MKNRKHLILVLFVLVKFLLQYVAINEVYELHRDEFLHIDLGYHPAWGYMSVPPLTGWLSFLIISLGKSVFWVKFFPALFGALTLVVIWKTVESLGGRLFALVLSALCVLLSALLRVNTLYQPNSLDILLWSTMFFTIIRFVQTHQTKWLLFTGVVFAFGFLNKYNISFLVLGLLPAMFFSKQRYLFRTRQFYGVVVLTLLLITPNLWWQYQNGFPVVWHLTTLSDTQLVHVSRVDFLKEQLLFFSGANFIILASFISFFRFRPFFKYRFLFWALIIILGTYCFLRAKSYYTIGLYPIFIGFGAVYLEHLLSEGKKRYLRPVLVVIPFVVIISIFRLFLPVIPPQKIAEKPDGFKALGMLRWEDGKDHEIPQDFADMQGWKELAGIVDEAIDQLPDQEGLLIHCDSYGMAGAINFYSRKKTVEALSLSGDYINWYPLDEMRIENVILVQDSEDDDPERKREASLFDSISLIGAIENKYARDRGSRVYLLKGAKKDINAILKEEIQENISAGQN